MKILMVCLGNICRSPLAEGVMQHLVKENGLDWHIDSAGTGGWHAGENPDRRSIRTARKHGIDISQQVCRQFSVDDFDAFDTILVMDTDNYRDVISLARDDKDVEKVRLLIIYQNIPDPYAEDNLFEPVFKLIEDGCKAFIHSLKDATV